MLRGKKRARDDDASPYGQKKSKLINTTNVIMDSTVEVNIDHQKGELLTPETIREGMLLLGCVTEVKSTFFVMSLPGCLSGTVPMNNISSAFMKSVEDFTEDSEMEEPSINSIVKVGMTFPCKVIEISQDLTKRKPVITLSINPEDVNAALKPSSLYCNMVLFVSVCSVEDHGYVVDVGNKYIHAFLSVIGSGSKRRPLLRVGAVIPTFVKRMQLAHGIYAKVQLFRLDFNEDFPEISVENVRLRSVLPGAKIRADVIEMNHPFVYMKYLSFDACASVLSLGSTYKAIKIGSTVIGTVLYVHPITHVIYLMLNMKPSPDLYAQYFGLRKYSFVENLKFQFLYKNRAYFKINKGTYGFIHAKDLPGKVPEQTSLSTSNYTVSRACVLFLHYMDNLVQMTAKPSMLEKNIIYPEDVRVLDIYDAVVKKHVRKGMFVQICPGLVGFVRQIHMSDVFVTKPELLHPVKSKIKCRVLSTNGKHKMNLTCKESLLNLQDRYVLSSYENAQRGQFYKGVIVQKRDEYILVLFFNDIKGYVSSSDVPKGSVFYEGQTVLCEVLRCKPLKKQLRLSLKTERWCSIEKFKNLCERPSQRFAHSKGNNSPSNERSMISSHTLPIKSLEAENKYKSETDKNDTALSLNKSANTMNIEDVSGKRVLAEILSVKGGQLNILVNETKGRVHITELGCRVEGVYPLRDFLKGEGVQVYIIGEHTKKKRNYLEISHKNRNSFKECTFNFPSVSLPEDFKPGNSLMGFVKEVHETYAVLWLTRTHFGMLDYLHFCESPKIVKKLHRQLKVGMSLEVSILECRKHSRNDKVVQTITLTKMEKKLPETGKNILGLLMIACAERGLILKLPFGYHGFIDITDLSDIYVPGQVLVNRYRKVKFLLCHVLEVNHNAKRCHLSLRSSRVHFNNNIPFFSPELTHDSIKEGEIVKGFVEFVSHSAITVTLGRNLEGKIELHKCISVGCGLCNTTRNIIHKHPLGSIVEVAIEKKCADGRSCILSLMDSKTLEDTQRQRLRITDDIFWSEMEIECENIW